MPRYGWTRIRPLPRGRIAPIAWSRVELRSTCLKPWGQLVDLTCRASWWPAQHLEPSGATCFSPPGEWLHAGSQRTHSKSTFPRNYIHIFAICCVLIFSEGPLVELFNCHHCKGQQVIFRADPFLLRNSKPGQSYNFISEHSWVIILSKSAEWMVQPWGQREDSIFFSISK